jgi:hypothetical protein
MVDPNDIYDSDGRMSFYQKKYDDYISGKSQRYFQIDDDDPRDIDFEKLRPVILMRTENGFNVVDGGHRVYLAKLMNKPVRSVIIDG